MNGLKYNEFAFLTVISPILILVVMAPTEPVNQNGNEADKIIGTWVSEAKDSKMELYKPGDTYTAGYRPDREAG